MSYRRIITVASLFLPLLGGCGSTVVMDAQSRLPGPDEAIVLTNLRANAGTLTLTSDDLAGVNVRLKEGDNFLALRLKSGQTYSISRYSWGGRYGPDVYRCRNPLEFTPTSDTMIYIGDIGFLMQVSSGEVAGMQPIVSDNEPVTIEKLKQKYAPLFEKYRYRKVLARTDKDIDGISDPRNETRSTAFGETSAGMLCRRSQREGPSTY